MCWFVHYEIITGVGTESVGVLCAVLCGRGIENASFTEHTSRA